MGVHDGHRQRKKEQFLQHGPDSFADHELLELLLYYAIPRRDTNALAHHLMEQFGSLENVLYAPIEELKKVPGIGESAALLLHLAPAVTARAMQKAAADKILDSVECFGSFFAALMQGQRQEVFYMACIDAKGRLLYKKKLSSGINSAAVSARLIAQEALNHRATGVLLGHNHPSGVAVPSREDQCATQVVQEALRGVGIHLVDHIIVAEDDFVSMRQSGLLLY